MSHVSGGASEPINLLLYSPGARQQNVITVLSILTKPRLPHATTHQTFMWFVPPSRHSMCTRPFLPHSWRRRPKGLTIMAGLDPDATVHLCHKRRRGQAELLCREVHRRCIKFGCQRVSRRGAATLHPCPVIRKDSHCRGHHGMTGRRRIRVGTHPRARVAVRTNHHNVRFFEVIDELV